MSLILMAPARKSRTVFLQDIVNRELNYLGTTELMDLYTSIISLPASGRILLQFLAAISTLDLVPWVSTSRNQAP